MGFFNNIDIDMLSSSGCRYGIVPVLGAGAYRHYKLVPVLGAGTYRQYKGPVMVLLKYRTTNSNSGGAVRCIVRAVGVIQGTFTSTKIARQQQHSSKQQQQQPVYRDDWPAAGHIPGKVLHAANQKHTQSQAYWA